MKAVLLHIICLLLCTPLFARHGKGGSITYEYMGNGSAPATSKYRITVKHYIDCAGTQYIESKVYVGIIDAGTNKLQTTLTFGQSDQRTIDKQSYNACINKKPIVCYVVVTYITETELPDNQAGYILAEQECCRIGGIINIQNSSSYGITNMNTIPGVIDGITFRKNSSPVYAQKDTAVICHNGYFEIDFSATDEDGDELHYEFCSGKTGGTAQARQPNPPGLPPYGDILYANGFSAGAPLGANVKIDPKTGIISGVAPDQLGSYVVSVCVSEFRNGKLIGVSKKEVQVNVADCNMSAATLEPMYVNCTDFEFGFRNKSSSPAIEKYYWDFGVATASDDTSTARLPFFTYPDTGTYVLKLKVSGGSGCEDSAEAVVSVYPGFTPQFTVEGNCYQVPFVFKDSTSAKYGSVNSWSWDLGDKTSAADTSTLSTTTYQYKKPDLYPVTLSVTSTKGCSASITKIIQAPEKPPLRLSARDTLICSVDSLQLRASGTGNISWQPSPTMKDHHTRSPVVFPKTTSRYYVTLDDSGCINQDSVTVRVVDFVSLKLADDTTICTGDEFTLNPVSDAAQYSWLPQTGLNDAFVQTPAGRAHKDTRYTVTASIGSCSATSAINIRVVNYPKVSLPPDSTICFGTRIQLNAGTNASQFRWSNAATLYNTNSLSPFAQPIQSTSYTITVNDTLGCPKPVSATTLVNVLPRVVAFAGNDTSVTANQPLQLKATGGTYYQWTPADGLSNSRVANPTAHLNSAYEDITYVVRVSTPEGCFAEDAVKVKIYKTMPDVFVPTAFTPNQDGMNDVLRPILVGIKKLDFFNVYNRWGKLVFSTTEPGKGWDGRTSGNLQENGNYVFVLQATDFNGKVLKKKGYFVLLK